MSQTDVCVSPPNQECTAPSLPCTSSVHTCSRILFVGLVLGGLSRWCPGATPESVLGGCSPQCWNPWVLGLEPEPPACTACAPFSSAPPSPVLSTGAFKSRISAKAPQSLTSCFDKYETHPPDRATDPLHSDRACWRPCSVSLLLSCLISRGADGTGDTCQGPTEQN